MRNEDLLHFTASITDSRSRRVFAAMKAVKSNQFTLCGTVIRAARKFHRPNTRIQETINLVFDRIIADPPKAA
jgi:hypothetical protein